MNKLYVGARVRITHINTIIGRETAIVLSQSSTGKWHTSNGYYIDIEGKTLSGTKGVIAIVELLNPIKRYKYRYKRK